jgi:hypothetical protein
VARRPPWSDADDKRMADLHGQGMSCNAIATAMERSPSVISSRAKKHDPPLLFERAQTAAANEARRVDAAKLRLDLELGLVEDAMRLRGRLFAPVTVFEWGGKDHDYAEKSIEQPLPADQLKLMQAIGAAVDRSLKIAEHETGAGVEKVKSLFGNLAEALGVTAYEPETDEPAQ